MIIFEIFFKILCFKFFLRKVLRTFWSRVKNFFTNYWFFFFKHFAALEISCFSCRVCAGLQYFQYKYLPVYPNKYLVRGWCEISYSYFLLKNAQTECNELQAIATRTYLNYISIYICMCVCTRSYCALRKIDLPHFRFFTFFYFIHLSTVQHVQQTAYNLVVIAFPFWLTIWLTALPVFFLKSFYILVLVSFLQFCVFFVIFHLLYFQITCIFISGLGQNVVFFLLSVCFRLCGVCLLTKFSRNRFWRLEISFFYAKDKIKKDENM